MKPDFTRRITSLDGKYLIPIYSNVLSSDSDMHIGRNSERAYDITAHNKRLEIYPIADGIVRHIQRVPKAPNDGGYGVNLIIDHGDVHAWYCHLEEGSFKAHVKIGAKLLQHDWFARVGATGQTSFPNHTHLIMLEDMRNYRRLLPESFWPKALFHWFPYAKSSQLDKFPIGGDNLDANTIFSVFIQGRTGFDETLKTIAKLKPRVVKIMDGKQSEIDAIRNHTRYVINRIYVKDSDVSAAIKRDPEGTAANHHAMIVGRKMTGVDYYQIQNEQNQHPPELRLLNRYYLRLMELCVSTGHRTTVIDCSVGNLHVGKDHPGDWEYVFSTLEYAQKHVFVVNCHQYSRESFWNPKYPNDWYLHRLEHTVMPVLDKAGFNKLLYVVGEFGLTRLLAVHGEEQKPGGWQVFRSHDQYRADLIKVMSYLLQWSDRILGYTCYLTHALAPWQTHEMSAINKDLADHYSANPQTIKPLVKPNGGNETVLYQARVVNASELNVRSGPPINGTLHPVVGKVKADDVVDVLEAASLWWKIRRGDLIGFSSSNYLQRINGGGTGGNDTLAQRVAALEQTIEIQAATIGRNQQDIAAHDERLDALEGGNGGGGGDITRRVSAGVRFMGITVEAVDSPKYRVKDIFTTHDGSWEVGDKPEPYGIEQWARGYLTSQFDDAGAEHHLLAAVLDRAGNLISNLEINYGTPAHEGNDSTQRTKSHSGWANIPIFDSSSFSPEAGERGSWAWAPPGGEIVMGGGLPNRHHVSTFVVWQEI